MKRANFAVKYELLREVLTTTVEIKTVQTNRIKIVFFSPELPQIACCSATQRVFNQEPCKPKLLSLSLDLNIWYS